MMEIILEEPKTRIKVIHIGALPNAGQIRPLHYLTPVQYSRIVKIWGIATNAEGGKIPIPFPYPQAVQNQVAISTSPTEVIVNTGIDRTNMTGKVYREYEID